MIPSTIRARRSYQAWVANETMEDYSLRYAARSFRKWSPFTVSNTALGGISFLALEAIGGTITLSYGFVNAFPAIIAVSVLVFITNLPIAYYSSRYNIDMDLLTRGAGFGYIGSTITSLIYAGFTFIFFALEAAIMAQALQLFSGLPIVFGYIVSSIVIIPIAFLGITLISRLQLITQPIWVIMLVAPFVFIFWTEPSVFAEWTGFVGRRGGGFQCSLFRGGDRRALFTGRANRRTGRLSTVPSGQDGREPATLVGGCHSCGTWLGNHWLLENPSRQPAGRVGRPRWP
jgi:hypothetical protein